MEKFIVNMVDISTIYYITKKIITNYPALLISQNGISIFLAFGET